VAARQHDVFSLAQLGAIGLSASAVRKRVASGRLYRVHRSVYSLAPPELLSRRGRYLAAVLACGPGAVLSHRSGADLHQLRATDRGRIDVTVPGGACRHHDGIDVHRSWTLAAAGTTIIDGIPVTTVARTLLDLAAVVAERHVERALNQAEILELLDVRALDRQLECNRSRPAASKLRAVLAAYDVGQGPTESELEEGLLDLCRVAGLPAPERQVYIVLGDGEPAIRVDFAWRAQRLIIETDGAKYHRTRRAFESDRRRDQRLALAGWRVVRVTWRQIEGHPAEVVRMISVLLAAS